MPNICYVEKKFSTAHEIVINQANKIIEEYEAQGFSLTLRQLYYQFVSRDLIANRMREYKRLGGIVNDARLAGRIDWHAIEDRTRFTRGVSHWDSPEEIVASVARQYQIDKWEGQQWHVEVWIEKDALIGVIERVCRRMDVTYFSCRGYVSQSEMWSASQRLKKHKHPVVIHLGDHDPSGVDMTRDIEDRLNLFGAGVEVDRIALTMAQIEEHNPPPNPAKIGDSRAAEYMTQFGDSSWELDALEPAMMSNLIENTILKYRNRKQWNKRVKREKEERAQLQKVSDGWDEIIERIEEE